MLLLSSVCFCRSTFVKRMAKGMEKVIIFFSLLFRVSGNNSGFFLPAGIFQRGGGGGSGIQQHADNLVKKYVRNQS